ncbi:MAG: protein translocase subunit SecD [Acidobacteriota bacterium]
MTNLRWRMLIILVTVVVALFAVIPPSEKIHLGLDLQGGIHLVLGVRTSEAVERKVESDVETVRELLADNSISFTDAVREGSEVIRVTGLDAAARTSLTDLAADPLPEYSVSAEGADALVFTLRSLEAQSIRQLAVQQSLQTLRDRVDRLGVREPNIQRQGFGPEADRILIQLPGVEDPERVMDIIKKPAFLEWRLVSYPPGVADFEGFRPFPTREAALAAFGGTLPSDTTIVRESRRNIDGSAIDVFWPLKKASPIKGNDLKDASVGQGQFGEAVVSFILTPKAGGVFEKLTQANIKRHIAILLDNKVISAPVVQSVIADRGQITSNFTVQSARDLVLQLKSGALPASLDILEQRTVGPSLGIDSIRKGVFAALLGFVLVMGFMVVYYRFSGLNAVVALLMNLVLVLAVMAYANATLTLPGIAGFILTIGMAVDANVLIFERIREEIRNGKSVRASVDGGFGKAFSAIVDSNVTTLIAAMFLFQYGTGPIRGFAVTLIVGILSSMFTALFVSRTIFSAVLARKTGTATLSI